MWEVGLPPFLWSFLPQPLLQAFPLLVAGWVSPPLLCSPAGLFIYSSVRDFPSPPLWHSGLPALFATCLFCCYCLLFSFSLFPGWGSICPGGYADLVQGCLWEYHVPLSSPCGLHFPSCLGTGVCQQRGSSPGFSIWHEVEMLCTSWRCGRDKVLPLLSDFSCKRLSKILL
jgi:hypothetical protein